EELRIEHRYHSFREAMANGAISSNLDIVLYEWCQRESNLTLFLNTSARGAVMAGRRRIKAVACEQLGTEKSFRLFGDLFIDCSGDGLIAADAGADFRMGRESRDEFGESIAPAIADDRTLGSSLLVQAVDLGRPVKFERPDWAYEYPTDEDLPFRGHGRITSGFWWIEYGGTLDMIADNEKIRDELLKCLLGVWDHIKNHGDHGADNYALQWVGFVPGKRESRRFLGDHVLTQNDVMEARLFEDRVAYGGWPIDLHVPEGIHSNERPADMYPLPRPYSIPFRCLYSRNIRNLMFAGRNVSASHVAFGTTRLMATGAVMGQAVGTAAALCRRLGKDPRALAEGNIGQLQQQLLRDDCYIIRMRRDDPDDVALGATATASSARILEVTTGEAAHRLDCPRAQMFYVTGPRLDRVSLLLESDAESDVEVKMGLRRAADLYDFTSDEDVATATASVPPGGRTWVAFDLDAEVEPGRLYWAWLPATHGLSWCHSDEQPPGANRAYREDGGAWLHGAGTYCFRLSPTSEPFGPENATNGFARPEDAPNMWASDPTQPLPQWLEVDFRSERKIASVHLTFDTNLDRIVQEGPAPECVRDYALSYRDGEACREILRVQGNHHRRRVHRFQPITTSGLRLEVLATNGAPEARLYEIRAYGEED
ncbi:MAG: FAD-dependent oxidoreductase, partial [Armatimonadota bacterium]